MLSLKSQSLTLTANVTLLSSNMELMRVMLERAVNGYSGNYDLEKCDTLAVRGFFRLVLQRRRFTDHQQVRRYNTLLLASIPYGSRSALLWMFILCALSVLD